MKLLNLQASLKFVNDKISDAIKTNQIFYGFQKEKSYFYFLKFEDGIILVESEKKLTKREFPLLVENHAPGIIKCHDSLNNVRAGIKLGKKQNELIHLEEEFALNCFFYKNLGPTFGEFEEYQDKANFLKLSRPTFNEKFKQDHLELWTLGKGYGNIANEMFIHYEKVRTELLGPLGEYYRECVSD